MNVLSLFSGVGGFDLGLEQAGMTTIYQCEWDKHATNILNRHWPHTPKWGDITTLTAQEILRHGTPPDVVAWGSPCQDLSVAGKRAGLEGERSGLFHEGMRLIRELRKETNNEYPRISIWENVAGALSSNNGADFGIILNEMAEAGAMVIEWSLLDAQHFGIPQRRRRVFVIAIFDPAIALNCPDPLLPVSESVRRDSPSRKSKGQAASRTLTEGVGGDGHRMRGFGDYINDDTASAIKARDHKDATDLVVSEGFTSSSFAQYTEGVGTLRSNGGDLGGGSETIVVGTLSFDTQFGSNANVFENTAPTLKATQAAPSVAYDEYNDSINDIHHALRAGTKQSIGVLEQTMAVRRLTPLECERLMGWPDDHTRYNPDGSEQADTHRYKQCGNGVASPVARWIAQHILNIPRNPA